MNRGDRVLMWAIFGALAVGVVAMVLLIQGGI